MQTAQYTGPVAARLQLAVHPDVAEPEYLWILHADRETIVTSGPSDDSPFRAGRKYKLKEDRFVPLYAISGSQPKWTMKVLSNKEGIVPYTFCDRKTVLDLQRLLTGYTTVAIRDQVTGHATLKRFFPHDDDYWGDGTVQLWEWETEKDSSAPIPPSRAESASELPGSDRRSSTSSSGGRAPSVMTASSSTRYGRNIVIAARQIPPPVLVGLFKDQKTKTYTMLKWNGKWKPPSRRGRRRR